MGLSHTVRKAKMLRIKRMSLSQFFLHAFPICIFCKNPFAVLWLLISLDSNSFRASLDLSFLSRWHLSQFRWASKKPGVVRVDLICSLALLVELTPQLCWFRSWCSFSLVLLGSFWFLFSSYTWPDAVSPTCLAITKFIESLSSVLLLTNVLNNLSELFEFK